MNMAGDRFGPYRLLRLLGRGGMAEVYLAEPLTEPGAYLAIKRLLPHFAENRRFVSMLQDEARIAVAIDHPNVGAVLDFGSVDGQHYMAMEYIDGVDLGRILRRLEAQQQPMPLGAALFIGREVALGLQAAHTLRDSAGQPQRVIHRDVSPHNILVSHIGEVKLIDFGVAKARTNSIQTRSGVIKGKLQYMSPEQAQAQAVDARSDVFSLGMTLYKIITGRLPFTGRTEYQVYDQILRRPPPPPRHWVPNLPERVEAVVMRALRKVPEGRFQSAAEMAAVLEVALAETQARAYDAEALAALVARALRAPFNEHDSLIESAEALLISEVEPGLDDASVDRLTRVIRVSSPGTSVLKVEPRSSTRVASAERALPHTQISSERALPNTVIARTDDPLELPPTVAVAVAVAQPEVPLAATVALPAVTDADLQQYVARNAFQAAATAPRIPLDNGLSSPSMPSLQTQQLQRRHGRRRWALLGAAGIMAGMVLGVVLGTRSPPAVEAVATPSMPIAQVDVGMVAAVPTDASVPVVPAVVEPDAAVPELDAALPPPPVPVPVPIKPKVRTLVKRKRARAPSRPRVAKAKAATGSVMINALPWAHVEIDGRRLPGNTPMRQSQPVGPHKVTLVAPDGRRWSKQITVEVGKTSKVVHSFQ
jgi:serine/threonine-protein kinase